MNENQFAEFFRNKLLKYSSPVPENMWQRIQQKKDKDRKGFFFKWFLVLSLTLSGGYFILHTNENPNKEKSISPANKLTNEISKNEGKNEKVNSNPDTTYLNQTNNKVSSNKQFDNNEKNYTSSNKHQNKNLKTDQYFSSKNISSSKYISKEKEKLSNHIRISRSAKDSMHIHINNASDSSVNNYQTDKNIVKKYPDTFINRQAIKIPLSKDSSSKDTLILSQNQSKKESNLSTVKKNNWNLDVYVSPDILFTKITSADPYFDDFIKRSHKLQMSFTVGARVSKSFAKHFSIKTGFQYSHINAKFSDSASVVIHRRSIDIPFLIGYDIKNVDFKTTINAGVIFNLYSWYKGRAIDSFGVADINYYKHNTGFSIYLGFAFAKRLNKKLQLFAEPYFRYPLLYMTKQQALINQKINIAGVSFGLKYNFQKRQATKINKKVSMNKDLKLK